MIEPHIHMYSRTTDDYQAMFDAGIRVCVEPSFWLGSNRRYPETFFDYFHHLLEFEPVRAERFGIDHYAAIAMNPKEADNAQLADSVINQMEQYLDHPRCVAVGEIGLNQNTDNEIVAFQRQLRMADQRSMPIIIHLPHDPKTEGAEIITDIIRAEGVCQKRILIDHNDEDSIQVSSKTDCYCGLTVYPHSKLDPQRVSSIVQEYGAKKIIVAGSADWGVSDPLSLVRVVQQLRADDHDESVIRRIIRDNADALYSHSPHWKPDFNKKPVPVSDYQR